MNPEFLQSIVAEQVVKFLANALKTSQSRLRPASRLREDLGVDGDDADELLRSFSERFEVCGDGFVLSNHFGPEAGWSPVGLMQSRHRLPLTVQDLISSAEAKEWCVQASTENGLAKDSAQRG